MDFFLVFFGFFLDEKESRYGMSGVPGPEDVAEGNATDIEP